MLLESKLERRERGLKRNGLWENVAPRLQTDGVFLVSSQAGEHAISHSGACAPVVYMKQTNKLTLFRPPKNIFDHCAQTLKRMKLKLGGF